MTAAALRASASARARSTRSRTTPPATRAARTTAAATPARLRPTNFRVGTRANRRAPHGPVVQVTPEVVGHGLHRRVPAGGLLAQRLGHDVVEVAAQRRRAACAASWRGGPASAAAAPRVARRRPHRTARAGSVSTMARISSAGELAVAARRVPAGQQQVEQHAQRVDVGGGGDVAARELLGRRVLGRQRRFALAGERRPLSRLVALQQLGDAEVEQLHLAVRGHQHVGGLEVAVHDQVRVRVGRPRPARPGTGGCAPRRPGCARRSSGRCARRRRAPARGRAGRSGDTPASMSWAMCGCRSRARMLPSRRKRASPSRPTRPAFSSLTAAWPWKRPSLRSASQTLPMPPWPSWRAQRVGADRLAGQRGQRRGGASGAFAGSPRSFRPVPLEQRLPARRPARRPRPAATASQRLALVRPSSRARSRCGISDPPAVRAEPLTPSWRLARAGRGAPSPSARCTVRSDRPRMAAISANEKPQKNLRSTTWASTGSIARQLVHAPRRCAPAPSASAAGSAVVPSSDVISNCPPRLRAWRLRTWSMISVAHDARGVGHEARAVGESGALAPRHVEVGLVQQRGGAQRQVGRSGRAAAGPSDAARSTGR